MYKYFYIFKINCNSQTPIYLSRGSGSENMQWNEKSTKYIIQFLRGQIQNNAKMTVFCKTYILKMFIKIITSNKYKFIDSL